MAELVLSVGRTLLSTIFSIYKMWRNRRQSVEVLRELQLFMTDLRLNIQILENKCIGARCSNITHVAFGAVQRDLKRADEEARTILGNGIIPSLWDADKALTKLQNLHQRVTTSFQNNLHIASFDVSLDTKQGIESVQESMNIVIAELEKLNRRVEPAAVSRIHNTDNIHGLQEVCLLEGHELDIQQQIVSETSQQATSSRSCAPVHRQEVLREQWSGVSEVDVLERDALEVESSNYLDRCADVDLSRDKLTATYNSRKDSANVPKHVLLHANLPCPSDCYPFYYFEVIVKPPVSNPDVAIGFSCTKAMGKGRNHEPLPKQLGMYPGSCGYYSLSGKIFYYDREKSKVVSIESEAFEAGDTVGAGFHSCTGNVFFTRCGEVVARVKESIFERRPVGTIFPSVGLESYGAKVKLNFGQSPYEFEPYPTCLDSRTCDISHLKPSPDGLSFKTKKNKGTFSAILADKPVPVRTSLFYFEVCIRDFPVSDDGSVALGFTGTDGFQQKGFPGDWKSFCGYQCHFLESFMLDSQAGIRLKSECTKLSTRYAAFRNDRIGAGIHYNSNEIFFVKNGLFIGALSNTLIGKIMPAIAVRNDYEMTATFGSCVNTIRKPSGFLSKSTSKNKNDTTLRLKKRGNSGIEVFQADNVVTFQQEKFYFELTVKNSGKYGNITVGFCNHRYLSDNMQPGRYPYSCGYHGATGMLFSGSETGEKFGPTFTEGDTVGAGISFNTNRVFFVMNGRLIKNIPNEMMSCILYPMVSLGSVGEDVHLNFGNQPFLYPMVSLRSVGEDVHLNFGNQPFLLN